MHPSRAPCTTTTTVFPLSTPSPASWHQKTNTCSYLLVGIVLVLVLASCVLVILLPFVVITSTFCRRNHGIWYGSIQRHGPMLSVFPRYYGMRGMLLDLNIDTRIIFLPQNQTENPRFDCVQPRNDYLECLHRWREVRGIWFGVFIVLQIKRTVAIMEEVKKQNGEKANGKPTDDHAHGH